MSAPKGLGKLSVRKLTVRFTNQLRGNHREVLGVGHLGLGCGRVCRS
jgi:hypothetical protein